MLIDYWFFELGLSLGILNRVTLDTIVGRTRNDFKSFRNCYCSLYIQYIYILSACINVTLKE